VIVDDGFERVRETWRRAAWPGVVESTSYGTPALKYKTKLMVRWREPGILVLLVDLDEKEMLMTIKPETYFETDHYKGYPAVLARLDTMDDDELEERLTSIYQAKSAKRK
jgi:hypothetical protein